MDNKVTGRYLKKVNNGFSIKELLFSISFMWIMISITAFVVFDYGTMRFVMIGLGVIGTIAQIIVLRKKKKAVMVSLVQDENKTGENRKIKVS